MNVAEKFNDHTYIPIKLTPLGGTGEEYSKLSVSPTTYVVDADKCQEEFKEMRAKLAKAMSSFRQSGMGDCPDDEKVAQSNRVFSSNFVDFVDGNMVLYYMYHLFILLGDNLLESAQTSMPEQTGHNPDDSRRTRGAAEWAKSHARQSSGKGRREKEMSVLSRSLRAPLKVSKTADEKRADYYQVP